jgi:hypothetical protein
MKRLTIYTLKAYNHKLDTIWCKYTTFCRTKSKAKKIITKLKKLDYCEFDLIRRTYIRYDTKHYNFRETYIIY